MPNYVGSAGAVMEVASEPKMEEINRVCAWCKKHLGTVMMEQDHTLPGADTTHGLCTPCRKAMSYYGLHVNDCVKPENEPFMGIIKRFEETDMGLIAMIHVVNTSTVIPRKAELLETVQLQTAMPENNQSLPKPGHTARESVSHPRL